MRASESTYAKVAENCSAYEPKKEYATATNSVCEDCHCKISCTTCSHFVTGEYCDLDLYDKIVKDHNF